MRWSVSCAGSRRTGNFSTTFWNTGRRATHGRDTPLARGCTDLPTVSVEGIMYTDCGGLCLEWSSGGPAGRACDGIEPNVAAAAAMVATMLRFAPGRREGLRKRVASLVRKALCWRSEASVERDESCNSILAASVSQRISSLNLARPRSSSRLSALAPTGNSLHDVQPGQVGRSYTH